MTHQIDMHAADQALGGAPANGVMVTDLRVVTMDFVEGTPTSHMVLADQVETFVAACKRLHFNPGVNPANGNQCARIWRIRVSDLVARGPYWWSTPDLGRNGDPAGALIFDEGIFRTAWIDEDHEVLC